MLKYKKELIPQLHFIIGKGGVGKSTYACALAKNFVQKKLRTLLVQVNAEDSHSTILETAPINTVIKEIFPLLWAVNVTPQESLREYLLLKFTSKQLYKLLFEQPWMRAFFRFIPSLAELNMLGKIWYHAEEKTTKERPKYERIIVDCPATGHGLRFLQVAKLAHEAVSRGNMAKEAQQIAKVLANPKRSGLHVVTAPEEMPVNETLQLIGDVQQSKIVPLYRIVINGVTKPFFKHKIPMPPFSKEENLCAPHQLIAYVQRRSILEQAEKDQINRIVELNLCLPVFLFYLHVEESENAIMKALVADLNALEKSEHL